MHVNRLRLGTAIVDRLERTSVKDKIIIECYSSTPEIRRKGNKMNKGCTHGEPLFTFCTFNQTWTSIGRQKKRKELDLASILTHLTDRED